MELQGALAPSSHLSIQANYTYTDSEDRSPGSPTFGKQLPLRPKNSANASASYRWPGQLTTSVVLRYAGPSFDEAENQIALGGYVLVDLKLSYALRERLELYARVENATGKHYETVYEYGTLGRVAYAECVQPSRVGPDNRLERLEFPDCSCRKPSETNIHRQFDPEVVR